MNDKDKNDEPMIDPDEGDVAPDLDHELEAIPEPEPGPFADPDDDDADDDDPEGDIRPDDVIALQEQIGALKDQVLRAAAETENVRKRAQRELEDANKYAIANFARDVVAISDNLHRALEHLTDDLRAADDQIKNLGEGVEMTQRALETALERHGIVRIEPVGEPFDHNFHQAMFEIEDAEQAPGTVVQVVQAGYRIHDRLLRPAMVGVAKKPAKDTKVDTEA